MLQSYLVVLSHRMHTQHPSGPADAVGAETTQTLRRSEAGSLRSRCGGLSSEASLLGLETVIVSVSSHGLPPSVPVS